MGMTEVCIFTGCGRVALIRGRCRPCYALSYRVGDLTVTPKDDTPRQRPPQPVERETSRAVQVCPRCELGGILIIGDSRLCVLCGHAPLR